MCTKFQLKPKGKPLLGVLGIDWRIISKKNYIGYENVK
jgi:hypothetical protein